MTQMAAYIAQLTPMEQKILNIAASHLETSFSLSKSIGFLEWQKEQHKQAQAQQKEHKQAQAEQKEHKQAQAEQKEQASTSAAAPSTAEAPRKKIKIFIKKKLNPALP